MFRTFSMSFFRATVYLVGLATFFIGTACGQTYPAAPVRIIVPYPPGGANDVLARIASQKFQEVMSQPFLVEHRPGANGNIAAAQVEKASPDGQTLILGNLALLVHNPLIYPKPGYDPRSFVPIGQMAESIMLVKVPAQSPFRSLRELVDFAKANPGKLNFGTSGNGSAVHLSSALVMDALGIQGTHIPMSGGAQVTIELIAGRIDLVIDPLITAGGKARILAVVDDKRKANLADVPAITELGYRNMNANSWLGLFAPRGVPQEVIARLNGEIRKALSQADTREKIALTGLEARSGTPEELAERWAESERVWTPLIRRLGIRME